MHLIVEKGSIWYRWDQPDGSEKVDETGFQVSVIPHTGEETALWKKCRVIRLIWEMMIGKYVERSQAFRKNEEEEKESELRWNFWRNSGF